MGEQIMVPTPLGRMRMTLPAGLTQSRQMRLRNKGIPAKTPGDIYVNLQIITPPADTPEAKEAYETLKRVAGFNPRQHLGV